MRRVTKAFILMLALSLLLGATSQETGESTGAVVQVAEHETLGPYLTDAEGRSLYLFLNDRDPTEEGVYPATQEVAPSTCYDQCAESWPPFTIEVWPLPEDPTVGEGLDASLLNVTEREDGSLQLAYNGWPLYYFARDENPGDTNGQGVGEAWYLVSSKGEAVGLELGGEGLGPASFTGGGVTGGGMTGGEGMTGGGGATGGASQESQQAGQADDGEEAGGVSIQVAEHETLGPYLTDAEGRSLYLFLNDGVAGGEGATGGGGMTGGEGDPAEGEGAPGAEGAPGGEGAMTGGEGAMTGGGGMTGGEGAMTGGGGMTGGSGVSTCYDQCVESWPPLLTEGEPAAGEGVAAELLGTTERQDGSTQVTYNGWPLHYFARDIPGATTGQGAGGIWYLVSAEGQPIGAQEEEPEESEEAEGEGGDPMVLGGLAGEGRPIYEANCAGCHGQQGGGGQGPALAGRDLSNAQVVATQIVHGTQYMPGFGEQLSNTEVAAVASFIRNAWGNEFGPVTEEEVSEVR